MPYSPAATHPQIPACNRFLQRQLVPPRLRYLLGGGSQIRQCVVGGTGSLNLRYERLWLSDLRTIAGHNHANGLGRANGLLIPHDAYLRLGRDDAERRESYRALFRAHVDEALTEEIRDATNCNFVLGQGLFQAQITEALGRRVVRAKARRPIKREGASDSTQGDRLG